MEYWAFQTNILGRKRLTPAGDGHPVIIFPGLATDGSALGPLRDHCESLGYKVIDWGQGYNVGPKGDMGLWLTELAAHISDIVRRHGSTATLIGWSLGGIYAREVGKLLASQVRQVITIGTPFNAEADHTNVGWLCSLMNSAPAAIDPVMSKRLRTPPPLPTTSIYSRSDGLVAWETCCHAKPSSQVQDIEIEGSHIGMGWNPAVFKIVADRLGQQPANWQPYAQSVGADQ